MYLCSLFVEEIYPLISLHHRELGGLFFALGGIIGNSDSDRQQALAALAYFFDALIGDNDVIR